MEKNFFRVVCIDENDPFEYKILEDENKESLDEVHNFIKDKYYEHLSDGVKWLLLPAKVII